MKLKHLLPFILQLAAMPVTTLVAAVSSINPVADAFLSASNASSNYGRAGSLEISAAGLTHGQFQSLLRFDLSSIKGGFDSALGAGNWTVTGVALQLNKENPAPLLSTFFNASAAGQIAVTWMKITAWTEGSGRPIAPGGTGVTFNDLASLTSVDDQSLGSFSFDGGISGTQTYSLTASSGLVSDVLAGNLTSFRLSAGDSSVSALFTSNNNPTGPITERPLLSITAVAVPEPSTCALLAVGCGGLLALRRHRQAKAWHAP